MFTFAFAIRSIIASVTRSSWAILYRHVVLALNCLVDASIDVLVIGLGSSTEAIKKFSCMIMSNAILHGLRTE